MREIIEHKLTKYIDELCDQYRRYKFESPCFEIIFTHIGDSLSDGFMWDQSIRGKTMKIFDKDEFYEHMFEYSLEYYITHIALCLVESPDHSTNITPNLIDAFGKMYEF